MDDVLKIDNTLLTGGTSGTKLFTEGNILNDIYENIFSGTIDRDIFGKYVDISKRKQLLRTVNNSVYKMGQNLKVGIDMKALHHKEYMSRSIGRLVKKYIEVLSESTYVDLIPLSKANCNDEFDIVHFTSPPTVNDNLDSDVYKEMRFIRDECLKRRRSKIYIATVYDLIPHNFKEIYKPTKIYYDYISQLKQMDIIIAVSNSTKNDLMNSFGIPEENIYVVYPALRDIFCTSKFITDESVLLKYKITKKFLVCTSGVDFRENMEGTIKGFIMAKENGIDAQLVVVCEPCGNLVKESSSDVIFAHGISDYEISVLYSRAYASIYVPLHEGFGIPIIESISCKVPAIVSNTSSMIELYELSGNNLILSNPYSVEDIANAIKYVFTMDGVRYNNLVNNAYRISQLFNADLINKELLNVYKYCLIKGRMTSIF
jgi:glycosyltransferase involved in cell wall biosynthesis